MSANSVWLLNDKVATGAGTSTPIEVPAGRENVPYVISGITTATVKIQGSLDGGTTWKDLKSVTVDEAGLVPAFPLMRGNVTAYTSGTIDVAIYAEKPFSS